MLKGTLFLVIAISLTLAAPNNQQAKDPLEILEKAGIITRNINGKPQLIKNYKEHPSFEKLPAELRTELLQKTNRDYKKELKNAQGLVYKIEHYANAQKKKKYKSKEYLVLDNGSNYEKTFSPQGMVLEEGLLLRNNIKHGEWKKYSASGELQQIITYEYGIESTANREIIIIPDEKNTLLKIVDHLPNITNHRYFVKETLTPTGNWSYFVSKNNELKPLRTEQYSEGQIIKQIDYYLQTGTKQKEQNYKNNQLEGISYTYDISGNVLTKELYRSGRPYYESGQPMYMEIPVSINNQQLIKHIEYFSNGATKSIGHIALDGAQGKWLEYAQTTENTTSLIKEYFYLKNIRVVYIEHDHNSKTQTIGEYNKTGHPQGLWLTYSPSLNRLVPLGYYTDGELTTPAEKLTVIQKNTNTIIVVQNQDKVLLEATFKDNIPNGWWTYHSINGTYKKINFINGICSNAILLNK